MKLLWLFWLPLLFLPNLGQAEATKFGTLELSDFLIVPYLFLAYIAARSSRGDGQRFSARLLRLLIAFLAWASLSTISIAIRYDLASTRLVVFGMLKLGKLALYGIAGVLTSKALEGGERVRDRFHYSLLASGCVLGMSLFMLGSGQGGAPQDRRVQGPAAFRKLDVLEKQKKSSTYKATNAISALMAVLICYLGGIWVTGAVPRHWGRFARFGLVIMSLGFFLSDGRGGWVAAFCGIVYLLAKRGVSKTAIVALAGAIAVSITSYYYLPSFRRQVDITLFPDNSYQKIMKEYGSGVAGVDDGARLTTWAHEVAKFADSPILGTGFFHRGMSSGLWSTGSHNFFLQMFLETGAPGGLLVLGILARMWRQAGTDEARLSGLGLPLRSALIAAFVGGMGGEYFYGGVVLLGLLLVYAPVGAMISYLPAPKSILPTS